MHLGRPGLEIPAARGPNAAESPPRKHRRLTLDVDFASQKERVRALARLPDQEFSYKSANEESSDTMTKGCGRRSRLGGQRSASGRVRGRRHVLTGRRPREAGTCADARPLFATMGLPSGDHRGWGAEAQKKEVIGALTQAPARPPSLSPNTAVGTAGDADAKPTVEVEWTASAVVLMLRTPITGRGGPNCGEGEEGISISW